MENLGSIAITSIVTLLVTILGGVIVDFVRKIKPKLTYSVKESIPIDLDGKKIGANIIEVKNPSSKTVKDLVLKISSKGIDIKNSGVKTTEGLEFEVVESTGILEIKIPFLKYKDYVSVTSILEDDKYVPKKPEVTVRSPDAFKLINLNGKDEDKSSGSVDLFFPAVIAAMGVAVTLSSVTRLDIPFLFDDKKPVEIPVSYGARDDQATNLVLASVLSNLPELSEKYVMGGSVYYYNQGPYIYSLARKASSKEDVSRLSDFLVKTIEISPRMSSRSKASIYFFLGKLSTLNGSKVEADKWASKSEKENMEEYQFLSGLFSEKND